MSTGDIFKLNFSYYMETSELQDGKLEMAHVLQPGITNDRNYGITLAAITTLPESIIERAKTISLNDSVKVSYFLHFKLF